MKSSPHLPVVTERPGPSTGIRHPRCYAAAHGDCEEKLSREHFVSEAFLEKLMGARECLTVSGLAHQDGQAQRLAPNALAAKVLCRRCNAALSALDEVPARVWTHLMEGSDDSLLFTSGHDLERWLLKLLCGHAASKTARHSVTGTLANWAPSIETLDALFGRKTMSSPNGLYALPSAGSDFTFNLYSVQGTDSVYGIGVEMFGASWILAVDIAAASGPTLTESIYRPAGILRLDSGAPRRVDLCWNEGAGNSPHVVAVPGR